MTMIAVEKIEAIANHDENEMRQVLDAVAADAAAQKTRPNCNVSREFLLAGNATFTVANNQGVYYTYRIRRSRDDERGRKPAWFVSFLIGPDNTSDYSYLGMLDAETGAVRLTRASRASEDARVTHVVRWALRQVWLGREIPQGYAIHHEGRCGRCGRLLTTPESIERGLGPECRTKMEF